jgi:hypothetical protein
MYSRLSFYINNIYHISKLPVNENNLWQLRHRVPFSQPTYFVIWHWSTNDRYLYFKLDFVAFNNFLGSTDRRRERPTRSGEDHSESQRGDVPRGSGSSAPQPGTRQEGTLTSASQGSHSRHSLRSYAGTAWVWHQTGKINLTYLLHLKHYVNKPNARSRRLSDMASNWRGLFPAVECDELMMLMINNYKYYRCWHYYLVQNKHF